MATELLVPLLGESVSQATLATWFKTEGDEVSRGEEIATLETDKATLALECPATGVLLRILAPEGTPVSVAQVIALIGKPGESIEGKDRPHAEQLPVQAPDTPQAERTSSGAAISSERGRVSPAARRMARQLGVDLGALQRMFPARRIMLDDVQRVHQSSPDMAPAFALDSRAPSSAHAGTLEGQALERESAAPGHRVLLTEVRILTGQRMLESIRGIPQFSVTVEADTTHLMVSLDVLNRNTSPPAEKVTMTAVLIHLAGHALRRNAELNAAFDQDALWVYDTVNMAVAMATPVGLVAPVIPSIEKMNLSDIASRLRRLADKARACRLTPPDLDGATFTMSNLGMLGVTQFTPIVNPPQVAILGVGCTRPMVLPVSGGETRPATLMSLTVTADHRAVDGAGVAAFLADLRILIESFPES
jgi:pyruvate dehydrogenase E2 component (dihydrolipoamide acetyltransferase)